MGLRDLILDPYTYLSYKEVWSDDVGVRQPVVPSWCGQDHLRRLTAYMIYDSFCKNSANRWMNPDVLDDEEDLRREYGDPSLIVSSISSSVLGREGAEIHIMGAGQEPRNEDGTAATAEDRHQDALRQWAMKERLAIKLVENEKNACKLGDGVMVLGWSAKRNRPVLTVWDPGFFFPVYEADGSDSEGFTEEFPSVVHLAYEFEDMEDGKKVKFVRRITYELQEYEDGGTLRLPWGEDSTTTCWMSDGVWRLTVDGKMVVDALDESKGRYRIKDLDLKIPFIPVIHTPAGITDGDVYGTSVLAVIMQLLEDIGSADTDLNKASGVAGSPVLGLSGGRLSESATYGPGTVFEMEGSGQLTALDMSKSLDALLKYDSSLLERLSVNSRVPESMLGRIKPNEVPSGIALWLSYAPHATMVEEMRQVRQVKLDLLLKFVSQWMQIEGTLDQADAKGDPYISFGSYLPADLQEAMGVVQQAMNATRPIMSRRTAIEYLRRNGAPVEDVATELALIQSEDFEGAQSIVAATGDISAAREYLGTGPGPELVEDEDDISPPEFF